MGVASPPEKSLTRVSRTLAATICRTATGPQANAPGWKRTNTAVVTTVAKTAPFPLTSASNAYPRTSTSWNAALSTHAIIQIGSAGTLKIAP